MSSESSETVVERLLDQFKAEMLAKLKLRAERHPDDNFLSMSFDEIKNCPLLPIIEHAEQEVNELYVARDFESNYAVMKENLDNANMNFIEWAIRKLRADLK